VVRSHVAFSNYQRISLVGYLSKETKHGFALEVIVILIFSHIHYSGFSEIELLIYTISFHSWKSLSGFLDSLEVSTGFSFST
jgi:hypothetical protein